MPPRPTLKRRRSYWQKKQVNNVLCSSVLFPQVAILARADGQGQPLYIARYEGLISSPGFNSTTFTVSNTAMRCEFEYKPAKDTTIRTSKRYGKNEALGGPGD